LIRQFFRKTRSLRGTRFQCARVGALNLRKPGSDHGFAEKRKLKFDFLLKMRSPRGRAPRKGAKKELEMEKQWSDPGFAGFDRREGRSTPLKDNEHAQKHVFV
jgi:hypothetical protein